MKDVGKFRLGVFLGVVTLHLACIYVVWYGFVYGYSTRDWILFVLVGVLRSFGVSVGYHRLLTHRSFKTFPWVEGLLYWLAAWAGQGKGRTWRDDHHQHHVYVDRFGDPHTPSAFQGRIKGFLWSHVIWLFFEPPQVPGYQKPNWPEKESLLCWQSKYYWLMVLSGFALCVALSGFSGLLLAGIGGMVVYLHITWCVNSICHMTGSRPRDPNGVVLESHLARDNWIIALLGFGEGFHGRHHAFQGSAIFGWNAWDFDPGKWVILLMERLKLAWDVQRPNFSKSVA